MTWEIRQGDCIEAMRQMDEASVDAVVADPPYGIGFMGHEWDQPGEFGPVASNGEPAPMQGGKRRRSQPPPASGSGHERDRRAIRDGVKFGGPSGSDNRTTRDRGGAMHAGRYDLSATANQRFQAWCEAWAREALRVLKPGGHLLAFGGTRTYHRLACAVEDAGFEIRDSLIWLYGSGFPKSLDVAKAIDKAAGSDGEWRQEDHPGRPGKRTRMESEGARIGQTFHDSDENPEGLRHVYEPETDEAKRWHGWGTALKPGHEPVVVARKPFAATVAANVGEHGTGALNVDGCRIATPGGSPAAVRRQGDNGHCRPGEYGEAEGRMVNRSTPERYSEPRPGEARGRWPGNVVLSHLDDCELLGTRSVASDGHYPGASGPSGEFGESGGLKGWEGKEDRSTAGELVEEWRCAEGCPVAELDRQSGRLASGANPTRRGSDKFQTAYGDFEGQRECDPARGRDAGGASRFFYCAKTSRAERNAGLDGFDAKALNWSSGDQSPGTFQGDGTDRSARNPHPTVKPVRLMRWLCRLVTPPGGVVLDPFVGSGTTGIAAVLEGFEFLGVEREAEYVEIARARVAWWEAHPQGPPAPAPRPAPGQMTFGA